MVSRHHTPARSDCLSQVSNNLDAADPNRARASTHADARRNPSPDANTDADPATFTYRRYQTIRASRRGCSQGICQEQRPTARNCACRRCELPKAHRAVRKIRWTMGPDHSKTSRVYSGAANRAARCTRVSEIHHEADPEPDADTSAAADANTDADPATFTYRRYQTIRASRRRCSQGIYQEQRPTARNCACRRCELSKAHRAVRKIRWTMGTDYRQTSRLYSSAANRPARCDRVSEIHHEANTKPHATAAEPHADTNAAAHADTSAAARAAAEAAAAAAAAAEATEPHTEAKAEDQSRRYSTDPSLDLRDQICRDTRRSSVVPVSKTRPRSQNETSHRQNKNEAKQFMAFTRNSRDQHLTALSQTVDRIAKLRTLASLYVDARSNPQPKQILKEIAPGVYEYKKETILEAAKRILDEINRIK